VIAVPADRSGAPPIPAGQFSKTIYAYTFGKVGGGTPTQPVPITYPNDLDALPGEQVDLYFYDEAPRNAGRCIRTILVLRFPSPCPANRASMPRRPATMGWLRGIKGVASETTSRKRRFGSRGPAPSTPPSTRRRCAKALTRGPSRSRPPAAPPPPLATSSFCPPRTSPW
jgi:hypothetical protein